MNQNIFLAKMFQVVKYELLSRINLCNVIATMLLVIANFAQAQQAQWIKHADTGTYDYTSGRRILVHPNGSIYVLGQISGTVAFDGVTLSHPENIFLARYGQDGTLIWVKTLVETTNNAAQRSLDLKFDSQGDIVIVGASYSSSSFLGAPPGVGPFLAKIDTDANIKWITYEPTFSALAFDVARRGSRIVIDGDDNIIWYNDQIYTQNFREYGGLALTKYNPDGTRLWNKYITSNPTFDHPILNGMTLDKDENIIVSGNFIQGNRHSLFLFILNPNGDHIGGISSEYHSSTLSTSHGLDANGDIYLVGQLGTGGKLGSGNNSFSNPGAPRGFIAKINANSIIQWVELMETTSPVDITQASDGYLYVTTRNYNNINYRGYQRPGNSAIIKIDLDGNLYGVTAAIEIEDPNSRFGSTVDGLQSLVDNTGNVYTLGDFRQSFTLGCLTAVINNYSFFLAKHSMSFTSPGFNPSIYGPVGPLCGNGSIDISIDPIETAIKYIWLLPPGTTAANIETTDPTLKIDYTQEADQKYISVIAVTGECTEYFSLPYKLEVSSEPVKPELEKGKIRVCPATSEYFSVKDMESVTAYEWSYTDGITSTPGQKESELYLHFANDFLAGTVTINAVYNCGSESYSFDITSYPVPSKPEIVGNIVICSSTTQIIKEVTPISNAIGYRWELPAFITADPTNPEHSSTLTAFVFPQFLSGQIRVSAIGECEDGEPSDPIDISRVPLPGPAATIMGPDQVCSSTSEPTLYQTTKITNATNYIWSIPDFFSPNGIIIGDKSIHLKALEAGTGIITVYGTNGCNENGDSVTHEVASFMEANDPILSKSECDDMLWLSEGTNSPEWFKDDIIIAGMNEKSMMLLAEDFGVYVVKESNFCGTKVSNPIEAFPIRLDETAIPNVITPNGDGKNDFFKVDLSLRNSSLRIMNRWGKEIYNNSDYQNDWDASHISPGIYYYSLTNKCLSAPYQGWLQIIR